MRLAYFCLFWCLEHIYEVKKLLSNSVRPHRWQPTRLASLGFSWQEYWSGLPFPSPVRESEVAQSCPTLSDPMDCSLPGSSVHGISQARVLEWGARNFTKSRMSTAFCKIPRNLLEGVSWWQTPRTSLLSYFGKKTSPQLDSWALVTASDWSAVSSFLLCNTCPFCKE